MYHIVKTDLKYFKEPQNICKKTDEFGKNLLRSIFETSYNSYNILEQNEELYNLFALNSELYYRNIGIKTENFIPRRTFCNCYDKYISNEINDELLQLGCNLTNNISLNLHNFEINECGIGSHHQLKSSVTMMALLLKIAEFSQQNYNFNNTNRIVTMEAIFENKRINLQKSRLKLWEIIRFEKDKYLAKLIDDNYQFTSNIFLNFVSIELPTHHSAVNTRILSDFFKDIQEFLINNIFNIKNSTLNLDKYTLEKDNSGNYNKFGLVHELNFKEALNSKNFFKYIQLILDFNNIHFKDNIRDPTEGLIIEINNEQMYTKDLYKTTEIYTISPYGYTNIIKEYKQNDNYIKTYANKFFCLLNGIYAGSSFNIVPDFLRFTIKESYKNRKLNNLISVKKYKYNNNIYISYNNLFNEITDRFILENLIIFAIEYKIITRDKLIKFIPYYRYGNKIKINKLYTPLAIKDLLKELSIEVNIKVTKNITHKKQMIDVRLFKILKNYIDMTN